MTSPGFKGPDWWLAQQQQQQQPARDDVATPAEVARLRAENAQLREWLAAAGVDVDRYLR